MVPDLTLSILSTRAVTWVVAMIVSTCFVVGAVRVYDTFRFAFSVGVSKQAWRTGALALVSNLSGDGSWTTRVGVTGIIDNWSG